MINKLCPPVPKLNKFSVSTHSEEVSYCKGSIFALLQSFFPYSKFSLLIRLLNANHAKITYLCNRFRANWGRLINKYLQTYLIVFPHFISVFTAHRKSVKCHFARYSSAPRCRARDTHIIWLLPYIYISYHFRRFDYCWLIIKRHCR